MRGFLASANNHGGDRSFWPIDFNTMKSHRAFSCLGQILRLRSKVEYDLDARGNSDGSELRVQIVFSSRAESQYVDSFLRVRNRQMDHVFRLLRPGTRKDSLATILRSTQIQNFV